MLRFPVTHPRFSWQSYKQENNREVYLIFHHDHVSGKLNISYKSNALFYWFSVKLENFIFIYGHLQLVIIPNTESEINSSRSWTHSPRESWKHIIQFPDFTQDPLKLNILVSFSNCFSEKEKLKTKYIVLWYRGQRNEEVAAEQCRVKGVLFLKIKNLTPCYILMAKIQ